MSQPRFALYFTPAPETSLARFGAGILGYDCDRGCPVDLTDLSGTAAEERAIATAEPRRYGFHATLKAPFQFVPERSADELDAAIATFAARRAPVDLGRLAVAEIGAFLALCPTAAPDAIAALAAAGVEALDAFRAPPSAADRERRAAAQLSPRQSELLDRWGYPYVFDEFRFHMTLAGPLPDGRRMDWRQALERAFAPLAAAPVVVDAVSLVRQDRRDAPFRVVSRHELQG